MLGYGPEDKNAVLELTYNYGITDYDKGNGYAQVFTRYFISQSTGMSYTSLLTNFHVTIRRILNLNPKL